MAGEWGADRVGIRFSPTHPFNDMGDSNPAATFGHVVRQLDRFGLAYLHIVEPAPTDPIPAGPKPDARFFRPLWRGPLIANRAYDLERGNALLAEGGADLISFAALYLANPDLPERLRQRRTVQSTGPQDLLWRRRSRLHRLSDIVTPARVRDAMPMRLRPCAYAATPTWIMRPAGPGLTALGRATTVGSINNSAQTSSNLREDDTCALQGLLDSRACLPPARCSPGRWPHTRRHHQDRRNQLPSPASSPIPAVQMDNGAKLYMKQHGDTVAGKKIELIRKDNGGINPPLVKRLAQELIVRDKVDILTGFALSPNGFAGADISKQAKKFMVIMNAATSAIIDHSPYVTRTSMTISQPTGTLGAWAAKSGIKRAYVMVTDYAPGHDAQAAFTKGFEAEWRQGGRLGAYPGRQSGLLRLCAARQGPQSAIDLRLHSGRHAAGLARQGAWPSAAIDPKKVKILTTGEMVGEQPLKSMGDAALGIIAGWHYDVNLDNPENKEFVKAYREAFHRDPDFFAVGGYDGMHLIYEALKKTKGRHRCPEADRCRQGHELGEPARPDQDRSADRATSCRRSTSRRWRRSAARSRTS